MSKSFILALAASTILAGAALASGAPSSASSTPSLAPTTSSATPTTATPGTTPPVTKATPTTTSPTSPTSAKPATPLVPFKGEAASFKPGDGDKSVIVSSKAGEWFTLNFASTCKALDSAKTIKLTQSKTAGWLKSGKSRCKVKSFETVQAPAGTTGSIGSAVPAVTPHQ